MLVTNFWPVTVGDNQLLRLTYMLLDS